MPSQFEKCLALVLRHEGGFVNHPRDPGGATNKGITIQSYRRFRPGSTVADLRNIPDSHVKAIYKRYYWDPIDGDGLGPGVDYAVFDLAVNSGVGRAKKMFRQVMHLHWKNDARLINELCDNRMDFLRGLKHWNTFGRGWTARVKDVRANALAMLRTPNKTPKPDSEPAEGKAWTLLEWLFNILSRWLR